MASYPVPRTETVGAIMSTETTSTLLTLRSAPVIHQDWTLTTLPGIAEMYRFLSTYRMNLPYLQTSSPVTTGVPMKTVTVCEDTQGMTGTADATRDTIESTTDAYPRCNFTPSRCNFNL